MVSVIGVAERRLGQRIFSQVFAVLKAEIALKLFDVVRVLTEHVRNTLRQGEPSQMLNRTHLILGYGSKVVMLLVGEANRNGFHDRNKKLLGNAEACANSTRL